MADTSLSAGEILAQFQTAAAITPTDFFLLQANRSSSPDAEQGAIRVPVGIIKAFVSEGLSAALVAQLEGIFGPGFSVTNHELTKVALDEVFDSSDSESSDQGSSTTDSSDSST